MLIQQIQSVPEELWKHKSVRELEVLLKITIGMAKSAESRIMGIFVPRHGAGIREHAA